MHQQPVTTIICNLLHTLVYRRSLDHSNFDSINFEEENANAQYVCPNAGVSSRFHWKWPYDMSFVRIIWIVALIKIFLYHTRYTLSVCVCVVYVWWIIITINIQTSHNHKSMNANCIYSSLSIQCSFSNIFIRKLNAFTELKQFAMHITWHSIV